MPFSSTVDAGKLLDYIYMKKSICQNMRDVPFLKLHIQLYTTQTLIRKKIKNIFTFRICPNGYLDFEIIHKK